jgi:gentisate 1,2-dioxygenase
MTLTDARFLDQTDVPSAGPDLWPAVVIPKGAIDAEVARLAAQPVPESGRRTSLIVHPSATGPGFGLAPGIQVSLQVLRPGERTRPIRHNSTAVQFCIAGGGRVVVDGVPIGFSQYDVWNLPSMATYVHVNDTDALQVRLMYSNAALLEQMRVHIVEDDPPEPPVRGRAGSAIADQGGGAARRTSRGAGRGPSTPPAGERFAVQPLGEGGGLLMPYEQLIDPPAVESRPLHWPWRLVKAQLDRLDALGPSYVGRRLYLLYNPATGRTNGTTPSFFATMTIRPPGIADRPHRHTSAAINYYLAGRGHSVVEGRRLEWQAGDLMFSAPGWGVHNHASGDAAVYELTIQDSPLNIAMESLLWQERLDEPPAVLGAERGFATNR